MEKNSKDQLTADSFADSWNNLPGGSVYSEDQFEDWLSPITKERIKGKRVLELGCGNASLMEHMAKWGPGYLEGVDLGESVKSAKKNMAHIKNVNWKVVKGDMVEYDKGGFDFVYCIGVLHHLKNPKAGFESVVKNTSSGGMFHCWVYAREGNWVIINIVDRIRKVSSRLPWWFTKYFLATPLVIPFYMYAKTISYFDNKFVKKLPLYSYAKWISRREFVFFRHVAFDQLVTPQTAYISKNTIEDWLEGRNDIDKNSTYIIFRNGNSWKFGGRKK